MGKLDENSMWSNDFCLKLDVYTQTEASYVKESCSKSLVSPFVYHKSFTFFCPQGGRFGEVQLYEGHVLPHHPCLYDCLVPLIYGTCRANNLYLLLLLTAKTELCLIFFNH